MSGLRRLVASSRRSLRSLREPVEADRSSYPALIGPYIGQCPRCAAGVGEWCDGRIGKRAHLAREDLWCP